MMKIQVFSPLIPAMTNQVKTQRWMMYSNVQKEPNHQDPCHQEPAHQFLYEVDSMLLELSLRVLLDLKLMVKNDVFHKNQVKNVFKGNFQFKWLNFILSFSVGHYYGVNFAARKSSSEPSTEEIENNTSNEFSDKRLIRKSENSRNSTFAYFSKNNAYI